MQRKLSNYIKENLKKGYKVESLKWALINQGYSRIEVKRAIEQVAQELEEERKTREIPKEKPKIRYEVLDEYNQQVYAQENRGSFWKRLFGL